MEQSVVEPTSMSDNDQHLYIIVRGVGVPGYLHPPHYTPTLRHFLLFLKDRPTSGASLGLSCSVGKRPILVGVIFLCMREARLISMSLAGYSTDTKIFPSLHCYGCFLQHQPKISKIVTPHPVSLFQFLFFIISDVFSKCLTP